jgi:hypothetical protein
LSSDKKKVRVYFWSLEAFGFAKNFVQLDSSDDIVNIIASDFDYDGRLDVLLYTLTGGDSIGMKVWFGNGGGFGALS